MKKYFVTMLAATFTLVAVAAKKAPAALQFDASKGVAGSITMPQGNSVHYTAYNHLFFVTNVEDSTYQYMNVFVPDGATQQTPVFLRTYVGGYMASKASGPQATDASGRALAEGYVLVIPGSRGRNSVVKGKKGKTVYTGRAPKGLLDLKAAIRYLRLFDKEMPGDAEKIITDGTSAGGAMSSLMGATGNHPDYADYLKAMGAADTRDDVFASVCYCPIIDLDHADMAYEWLYGCTNNVQRPVTDAQKTVSTELAAQFPAYLASLNLKTPEGTALNADNYLDYIKHILIKSAQEAKDAGADIPDSIGFKFSNSFAFAGAMPPLNGGIEPRNRGAMPQGRPQGNVPGRPNEMMGPFRGSRQVGEYITDLDMTKYLNYVVTTQRLKTPPAFDSKGVAGAGVSGENEEFGDATGSSVNFTDYSVQKVFDNADAQVPVEIQKNIRLLNPMNYIGIPNATVARYWYIRHGARDRDTSFAIPVNLALRLQNAGKDVDFKLPWNRPHSGDYALNELFDWIKKVVK